MSLPTIPDRKTVLEAEEEQLKDDITRMQIITETIRVELEEILDELAELSCP